MALSHQTLGPRLACGLLVSGLVWSATTIPAAAQDVPASQILNALAPPVTRSLSGPSQPPMSAQDRAFVDSLHGRTRSLTVDEGEHVAKIAEERPKIDLEIYFDFNSWSISRKAEPQLEQLAKALRSAQLNGSEIVISGYTDAKGTEEYNQKLSEHRAEAVKKFLVTKLKVPAEDLTSAGYGKRHLKNSTDPYAAENRRVQIINLGTGNTAQR